MKAKKTKKPIRQQLKHSKQQAVLAFVPKQENQFRPFLVRRMGIVFVIALAVGIQFIYNFSQTGSVLGQAVTISTTELLSETNARRAEAGLPSLTLNDQLSQASMLKANDIIQNQYWSHVSPSGVNPWQWITKSGYNYQEAGENLAKNFTTASATVAGWMASDSHRENMLKPSYSDVGFAVTTGELDGKPTTIIVALYAQPMPKIDPQQSISPYITSASSAVTASSQNNHDLSFGDRLVIAFRSFTPASLASIILLSISIMVAVSAHAYRHNLPNRLQKTWYKRHGVIKASLLLTVIALIILLYGSGSL